MDDKKERMDSGVSSFSSSSSSSAVDSSEYEDLSEEVNSSSSSSSNFQPLQDMSSLLQDLPIKRGLSNYYNGKSRSFTSLSNVRELEDLAKLENPYNKKLKSCRSYGGLFLKGCGGEDHGPRRRKSSSRLVANKTGSATGRSCCSSLLSGKRTSAGFIGNKPLLGSLPPIPPPQRSAF